MKVNVINGKINRRVAKKILMNENTKLIELENYTDDYVYDAINSNENEIVSDKMKNIIINLLYAYDVTYEGNVIKLCNVSSSYKVINENIEIKIVS